MNNEYNLNDVIISVVIPAYNEEKLISFCLVSLLKQDFDPQKYEVIVVDNGSNDNTSKIVKSFSNVRLTFEPNKSISCAIDKGISLSKGKIIAVTNADTVVPTNWLSNIYNTFKKNHEIAVVTGRILFNSSKFLSYFSELFMNLFGGIILKSIQGPNFAIKKDIYYKIGGLRKDISFNCELELFLRVKKVGKVVYLWDNPVITSSRHFKGYEGIKYCLRGIISSSFLLFFNKPVFIKTVDIR